MTNFLMCNDKTDCPSCGRSLHIAAAEEDYVCVCPGCETTLTVSTEWQAKITATVPEVQEPKPCKKLYSIPASVLVGCTVYVEANHPEHALEKALRSHGPAMGPGIMLVDTEGGELSELDVESAISDDVSLVKEIPEHLEFCFREFGRTGKPGVKPSADTMKKYLENTLGRDDLSPEFKNAVKNLSEGKNYDAPSD